MSLVCRLLLRNSSFHIAICEHKFSEPDENMILFNHDQIFWDKKNVSNKHFRTNLMKNCFLATWLDNTNILITIDKLIALISHSLDSTSNTRYCLFCACLNNHQTIDHILCLGIREWIVKSQKLIPPSLIGLEISAKHVWVLKKHFWFILGWKIAMCWPTSIRSMKC